MHINEGKGKIALFSLQTMFYLPLSFSQFCYFPFSIFLFPFFPPPPPHFYCFPSTTTTTTATFLLFSLHHHHHHISIVFPPPPPPPHFLSFIDLKVTRSPKPTKNSTRPYLNEISAHFTHEIKTKGYDVIDKPVKLDILNEIPPQVNEIPAYFIHEIKTIAYDVSDGNLFPPTLIRFPPQKTA